MFTCLLLSNYIAKAQTDTTDLLKGVTNQSNEKQYVTAAFKSSRIINGHSMELIGKNVLDFRILHRFGYVNDGISNLFGLDEARMRMGFDYGITNNLTIGIGRSTLKKELDGFFKWRPIRQATGAGGSPVSVVWISGMTLNTLKWAVPDRKNYFSSRLGYYHEIIIGRKFSERFSLQLAPLLVHRNLIDTDINSNNTFALGIGSRLKVSKRMALVLDYHPVLAGEQFGTYDPLSIGIDIETGGHVFQLHFSNSEGMNEKEFVTNTTGEFWKGEIRFGFNLSRVFSLNRNR
ncbi:MAG: hypothetical protein H7Y31_12545 [Chitinophagaceae bacterium]|nr:hypothetical protein [Chitinophagaceae bacterium]